MLPPDAAAQRTVTVTLQGTQQAVDEVALDIALAAIQNSRSDVRMTIAHRSDLLDDNGSVIDPEAVFEALRAMKATS